MHSESTIDAIICGGFSQFSSDESLAVEKDFLLTKDEYFGDIIGLYKALIDRSFPVEVTDVEAPPFVCYVLKSLLAEGGFSSEMVFYLDRELDRAQQILAIPHRCIFLTTTLISSMQSLRRAVNTIRSVCPDSIIVAGGAFIDRSYLVRQRALGGDPNYQMCSQHFLFQPCQAADDAGIDRFLLLDSQLRSAQILLRRLREGRISRRQLGDLPNSARAVDGQWLMPDLVEQPTDICPASVRWDRFRSDEIRRTAPIAFSAGCPNKCAFCNFDSRGKRRKKSIAEMTTEIAQLMKWHPKVSSLYFCDDNFAVAANETQEIPQALIDLQCDLRWGTFIDARHIDGKIAELMKRSGCSFLKIGMESADDRMLSLMRKPCRVRDYTEAVASLCGAGISVDAFFIIGFPGEDGTSINTTVENINRFSIPSAAALQCMFFPFVLAPLSAAFEIGFRKRFSLEGCMSSWQHKSMAREQAVASIPAIMSQVLTMQPHHGNAEKLVVRNGEVLCSIDSIRGRIVRNGASNRASPDEWQRLGQQLARLKPKNDDHGNPILDVF